MIQLRVYAKTMLKAIAPLTDEEIGRLFVAMLNYTVDKTASPLPGNEQYIWGFVQDSLDAQHESYEKRCTVNKANRNGESSRIVTNRHKYKYKYKNKYKDKLRKVRVRHSALPRSTRSGLTALNVGTMSTLNTSSLTTSRTGGRSAGTR